MATKTCMENPVNLRCLGGLAGYEGRRVRPNCLLRSGEVTKLAAMQIALNVKREYPDCTYETAEEKFGSFSAFIQTGIGVSDAEIARLRELYPE